MKITALIVVAILFSINPGHASTPVAIDLTGHVTLPEGISGPATVFVPYALSKTNGAHSTPTRYPLLPRRTRTDQQGNFKIGSLDPDWDYAAYVLAPGCKPKVFGRCDPAAGPLEFSLDAVNPTRTPPGTVLRGRVLDDHNLPIAGALVTMQEVTRNGIWHFSADNIDPFSVSDENGDFLIYGQTPFTDAGGAIGAPGFATGLFEHWAPGETDHELRLIKGATLQGRLLQAGKPVANAEVRLDRFGAESGSTAWKYTVLTDHLGHFSFAHLPPNRNCRLHGVTGSLGDQGVVPMQSAQIGENDSTNDLGDLNLEPALNLEGRIRLTDGHAVPANSFLYFGDFDGEMSLRSAVHSDGSFRLTGFPAGNLHVYLRIPGYELTPEDSRLISGSATNVAMVTNVTGWVINLAPATRR